MNKDTQYESIVKDLESGLTYEVIREKYHVSFGTISRIAGENKLLKRVRTKLIPVPEGIKTQTMIEIPSVDKIDQWMTINFDIRKYMPNMLIQACQLFLTLVKKQYPKNKCSAQLLFAIEWMQDFLDHNA